LNRRLVEDLRLLGDAMSALIGICDGGLVNRGWWWLSVPSPVVYARKVPLACTAVAPDQESGSTCVTEHREPCPVSVAFALPEGVVAARDMPRLPTTGS
jgi:hypothetical protein